MGPSRAKVASIRTHIDYHDAGEKGPWKRCPGYLTRGSIRGHEVPPKVSIHKPRHDRAHDLPRAENNHASRPTICGIVSCSLQLFEMQAVRRYGNGKSGEIKVDLDVQLSLNLLRDATPGFSITDHDCLTRGPDDLL
jgi:hypothetical protein